MLPAPADDAERSRPRPQREEPLPHRLDSAAKLRRASAVQSDLPKQWNSAPPSLRNPPAAQEQWLGVALVLVEKGSLASGPLAQPSALASQEGTARSWGGKNDADAENGGAKLTLSGAFQTSHP